LAAVVLVVAAADSAVVVDLAVALAARAVAAEVSVAAAPVAVGRAKDGFVSIRSTQKLRWLKR
jgi:hypothetical protein